MWNYANTNVSVAAAYNWLDYTSWNLIDYKNYPPSNRGILFILTFVRAWWIRGLWFYFYFLQFSVQDHTMIVSRLSILWAAMRVRILGRWTWAISLTINQKRTKLSGLGCISLERIPWCPLPPTLSTILVLYFLWIFSIPDYKHFRPLQWGWMFCCVFELQRLAQAEHKLLHNR